VDRVKSSTLNQSMGRNHDLGGEAFRLLSPEVAYVRIGPLKRADIPRFVEMAKTTKGMVIDIRNYPTDFPIFDLGGHLTATPANFATFTDGDLGNPGAFHFGNTTTIQPKEPRYNGKVTILVDESTQSSAEYHVMAFRAVGGVVVGSTTAGADGNVSRIPLPGGLSSMFTGIGVFYPDRKPTQRIGIVPDVVARPTMSGVAAGRDEVLEAALRIILGAGVSEAELRRMAKR
jgi:C-terminal processing protease CtpA/Prc